MGCQCVQPLRLNFSLVPTVSDVCGDIKDQVLRLSKSGANFPLLDSGARPPSGRRMQNIPFLITCHLSLLSGIYRCSASHDFSIVSIPYLPKVIYSCVQKHSHRSPVCTSGINSGASFSFPAATMSTYESTKRTTATKAEEAKKQTKVRDV